MAVIETIAPIFLIMLLGNVLRRGGFLRADFAEQANRLTYLFTLPALIFTGIVRSNVRDVTAAHIMVVILPTAAVFLAGSLIGAAIGLRKGRLGSFIQSTFHGNISYIGLAVVFYALGEEGLKKGSILVGFLILFNNALAIALLSWTSGHHKNVGKAMLSVVKTPLILAAFAGMAVIYLGIPVPQVLMKTMGILANMALPVALVLIGASISFGTIRNSLGLSILSSCLKLGFLPYLAVLGCHAFAVPLREALPALILLATPTATTSYIMAREIGGDMDLASAAVTLSTLLSPIAFVAWAAFAH
jgi:malate permease and related proteins